MIEKQIEKKNVSGTTTENTCEYTEAETKYKIERENNKSILTHWLWWFFCVLFIVEVFVLLFIKI